jgi:hypothetical protein
MPPSNPIPQIDEGEHGGGGTGLKKIIFQLASLI